MSRLFLLAIALTAIAACSGGQAVRPEMSDEEQLRERVKSYCEARRQLDWKSYQSLLDPDIRESFGEYFQALGKKNRLMDLLACDATAIVISSGRADVTVRLSVQYQNPMAPGLPPQQYDIKEAWIKKDKSWYLVMTKGSLTDLFGKFGYPVKGGDAK